MNKVLILSADEALRQKYIKELVKSGFHVADSSDFLDGMLTASKSKFDVILIDEEVDGSGDRLEFTKIRKYSDAHLIYLGKNPVDKVATGGDGFDAYFQRSSDPQELITYIKGMIEQPEVKREMMLPKRKGNIITTSQSESIVNIVADLEQQVAKIKAVMAGINRMQGQISDAEVIVQQQYHAFELVLNKLADVNKSLESLAGE